jgi:hypothetical protein
MKHSSLFSTLAIGFAAVTLTLSSCKKDDDSTPEPTPLTELEVPATYSFSRNGSSSVSYSGQTDRLNQLAEIKEMLKKGDNGELVDAQALQDMFENKGDNGGGHFSFSSSKQLKDKTFQLDTQWFVDLLNNAATASADGKAGTVAAEGVAGLATRGSGSTILVDGNGREYTQLVEKGLMGATFINQIANTYLTDEKIGEQVNNTDLVDGKNYTTMEHHMDEAFGYFGAPEDFTSNYTGSGTVVFWAKYSNEFDALIGSNEKIMKAYRTMRAAISANRHDIKKEQRKVLYAELEKLVAACAIHYVNEALAASNTGDRLHVLSECYAFVRALRYQHGDYRKVTQAEVDNMMNNEIGENLWQTTSDGLNNVKNLLSERYGLESVKNDL